MPACGYVQLLWTGIVWLIGLHLKISGEFIFPQMLQSEMLILNETHSTIITVLWEMTLSSVNCGA